MVLMAKFTGPCYIHYAMKHPSNSLPRVYSIYILGTQGFEKELL